MNECILDLPQFTIQYPQALPSAQHLLVIGGRPPAADWLRKAAQGRIPWAVDHGIDICREAGIPPKHLLGDRDSSTEEAWDWGSARAIPVDVYPPEKDLTDTQIALKQLSGLPHAFAVITGAFGGRFDHAFANVLSCAHASIPCCLADEKEAIAFLKGSMELRIACKKAPAAVSLLPLAEECSGATISNVHWPLENARLRLSFPNAISNRLEGKNEFPVALQRGTLGVYLLWE